MWGRGHWNICKWSPRGDTNFMGLEFSSANLNNQMWEQKKKPLYPATTIQPPPQLHTSSFNPHLRPHLCSLLPGPHIRGAQYVQTLIRISLRGRQGRREKRGGWKRRALREGEEGPVYLIRQNCRLLITTPFSQQASLPHPASVNMERGASQSPQHSLSSNGRIKTV